MAALDEPDRWTFRRGNQPTRKGASEIAAAWHSVRSGAALGQLLEKSGLSQAMRGVAKWKARKSPGLRPGFTRGGKDIDDAGNTRNG